MRIEFYSENGARLCVSLVALEMIINNNKNEFCFLLICPKSTRTIGTRYSGRNYYTHYIKTAHLYVMQTRDFLQLFLLISQYIHVEYRAIRSIIMMELKRSIQMNKLFRTFLSFSFSFFFSNFIILQTANKSRYNLENSLICYFPSLVIFYIAKQCINYKMLLNCLTNYVIRK